MALPTTVFQVPELGQIGYVLGQQRQEKRKVATQKREGEVVATGVGSKFMSEYGKILPASRALVKEAYDIWKAASTEYQMSGSASAKEAMEQATQQFYGIFGSEVGMSESLAATTADFQKTGGKNYADTVERFNEKRERFSTKEVVGFERQGNKIIVNYGGVAAPWNEHARYSPEINELNSPQFMPKDPRAQAMDITATAQTAVARYQNTKGIVTDNLEDGSRSYNVPALWNKIDQDIDSDIKNDPVLVQGIYLRHEAKALKALGIDQTNLDAADVDQIISKYSNSENLRDAAIDGFKEEYKAEVERLAPASTKPRAATKTGGEDADALDFLSANMVKTVVKGTNTAGPPKLKINTSKTAIKAYDKGSLVAITGVSYNPDGSIKSLEVVRSTGVLDAAKISAMTDEQLINSVLSKGSVSVSKDASLINTAKGTLAGQGINQQMIKQRIAQLGVPNKNTSGSSGSWMENLKEAKEED